MAVEQSALHAVNPNPKEERKNLFTFSLVVYIETTKICFPSQLVDNLIFFIFYGKFIFHLGIFSLSYFKLFHQLQKLWHHDKYYYTEVRVNLWICILYCYLFDHKTRSIVRYIQRNISLKILRKYCSWVRGFSPKSSIC